MPFVQLNGQWTIDDNGLFGIWRKLVEQNLVDTVFWNGAINSPIEFIDFCKQPGRLMSFFIVDRECVAFAWLHPITGNYALAHFCIFKEAWGKRSVELGHICLDNWFGMDGSDGEPLLDLLIGIIPKFNNRAHRYIERIGFEYLGEIPRMMRLKNGDRNNAVVHYRLREK